MSNIVKMAQKSRELQELLATGHLLAPTRTLREQFRNIETDFKTALDLANWQEENELPGNWKAISNWSDMCEQELGRINGELYQLPDYSAVIEAVRTHAKDIDRAVMTSLRGDAAELVDYVSYHFKGILRASALKGNVSVLFDRIDAAYVAGGWPCGWSRSPGMADVIVYSKGDSN